MRKLSKRGKATILVIVAVVLGVCLINAIDHSIETSAKEWQAEQGIEVEYGKGYN